MEFQKIDASSLKQIFIEQMEEAILSGELAIGEKLPTERELEEQMNVSRNVISSGFTELERIGFIEIRPRQGTFVANYPETGSLEMLVAMMRHNGGSLKFQDMRSLLEFRQCAEEDMVHLAILRASDEDILTLHPFLESLEETSCGKTAAEISFEFYHRLAIISQNTAYPLLYNSFRNTAVSLWTRYCERYGIPIFYKHREILYNALLDRDEKTALTLIQSFMNDTIYGDTPLYTLESDLPENARTGR